MKIVHVIDSLATGGAERLVVDFAVHGIKQGHDMSIVVLEDTPGTPRTRAMKHDVPLTVLGGSLKDPRHLWRIRAATQDADIVHVHLFPALYWSVFSKKPVVFTEHNTHNRRMGKALYRLPERWAYRHYSRIIAISNGVAEAITTHLASLRLDIPVTVAVNGIADEFFEIERSYAQRPSQLAAIGSFSPRKQHHLAIQAVAQLPDVTLKIAGDGPLRPELEKLIDELGVGDRIELLGIIDDIPGLLRDSDAFLSTSLVEGFGLAAGEAMASGLPAIGPNVPGLKEVVPDGVAGVLFKDYEPATIAKAIEQVLSAEAYREYSEHARAAAGKYSLADSFAAQLAVYRDVLAGSQQQPL